MTGLIRKAMLMTILGVLAAEAAMAGVPSASNSTIIQTCVLSSDNCPANNAPASLYRGMYLGAGGSFSSPGARTTVFGPPDQMYDFSVTLIAGNGLTPVGNYPAVVDFTACHQLILGVSAAQTYIDASGGITVSCGGHTATKLSLAGTGVATFRIVAGSADAQPLLTDPAEPVIGCGKVTVDNVQIGPRVRVVTPDLNNNSSGGVVSGADQGKEIDLVSFGFGNGRYIERGDINHTGNVTDGADLSAMIDMVAYWASPTKAPFNVGGCTETGGCCTPAFQIP